MKNGSAVRNRIKLNDMAYDAALVIFPLLLGHYFDQMASYSPGGVPSIQIFLAAAIYFLPLLIGKMYAVDFGDSPARIRKCVLAVLFVTMFFAYGNLLYLVMPGVDRAGSYGPFILVTATVFLIMGPIAGLMFTGRNAPRVEGASTQMIVFLFTMGMLPLFFVFISGEELFGDTGILLSILITAAVVIADVILIILLYLGYSKLKKAMIRAGAYDACVFAVRLLTPFCVSFLLVVFFIYSDRLFLSGKGSGGIGSVLLVILLYVISGVLPLRIMLMLAPPVRPASILIGGVSVLFTLLAVALK